MKFIAPFIKDESGATAIEYGLIAGIISLMIVVSTTSIGTILESVFTEVDNGLEVAE